jgi:hypothetical protein
MLCTVTVTRRGFPERGWYSVVVCELVILRLMACINWMCPRSKPNLVPPSAPGLFP